MEALEERHALVATDLATATEALDNYRDSLVAAEVRMAQDRDKMGELQDALQALQAEMLASANGATGATGPPLPAAAGMTPLPLGNALGGCASSRVHFLYFLSSFLLLKTALCVEGRMSNVPAHEVFEEICRNQVPLEEWPTYIFTRVYSTRGHDQEVAALKAVAKRAAAREQTRHDTGKE